MNIYLNLFYRYDDTLGAIQKVCHRPRVGGESSKLVTNSDKGEGVKPNSDVTAYEKIL